MGLYNFKDLVDLEINLELRHLDERRLRHGVDARRDDDVGNLLQVGRHDGAGREQSKFLKTDLKCCLLAFRYQLC